MPDNILTPVGNLRGQLTSGGLIPGLPVIIGEASGNPAHITDGSNNIAVDYTLNIEPIQEGSGIPSLNNIRNIIGFNKSIITVSKTSDPNTGIDYIINFGQDVFGAQYKASENKLIIDRYMFISDENTEWLYGTPANNYRWSAYLSFRSKQYSVDTSKRISSAFVQSLNVYSGSGTVVGFTSSPGTLYVRFNDPYYNTSEIVGNALNGIQFVYPLETPIELNINQIPIMLNKGENYIWNDSGNIDLKYIIDTEIFLQWLYDNVYNP